MMLDGGHRGGLPTRDIPSEASPTEDLCTELCKREFKHGSVSVVGNG